MIIGTPHIKGAGYFVNDKELKTRQEADIQTCPHCQAVIKMQEWRKDPVQNFCLKCMRPACNDKVECLECVPFIKKLDLHHDAVIKYNQHLKVAGLDPVDPPSIILTGT